MKVYLISLFIVVVMVGVVHFLGGDPVLALLGYLTVDRLAEDLRGEE